MSYALADPFFPGESDSSRVVLGWARARYEFARRLARPDYHIVDVGCGAGFGARILNGYCLHYTGIDRPDVVDSIRRRRRYTYPHTEFLPADLDTSFPDLSHPADLVLGFEVIEHLKNPERFLSQVRQTMPLAPRDSHLLISTPVNPGGAPRQKSDHVREYSQADLRTLLQVCGFQVLQFWTWGAPFGVLARGLMGAGVSVFREGFDRDRGRLSRIADRIPGARKLSYVPQKYGRWGDWGVTLMADCQPL